MEQKTTIKQTFHINKTDTKQLSFKEIVTQRYATKKFDGRILPQEKVEELLDDIRLSASSFGLQPWKIKVVTDPATKALLSPIAWNQAQITTCSHLLIFCADTNINKLIDLYEEAKIKDGATKEGIAGYIEMMRGFDKKMTPEQKLTWAQKQCYIALGNALNGAKALGFDSCPMEGFDSAGFAKALKLPANLVPTVLCPIGYASPDDKSYSKIRFSKEQVFF